MLTVKARRFILLFALLVAIAGFSFLTDKETGAQAPNPSVSDAPALMVVSASTTVVELRWNAVTGAVSYDLRAWWTGAGSWQRIDEGSQTDVSFTHRSVLAGRKYHYIVAGVGEDGIRGPWSAQVEVTVPGSDAPTSTPTPSPASTYTPTPTVSVTATPTAAAGALPAPTLHAEAGAGQITLSWGAVSNADSYQLVVWDWAIDDWRFIGGAFTGLSYIHGGLAAGTTYFFHVRALATGGAVSPWSAQLSATTFAPGTPTPTATQRPLVTTATATPTPTPTAAMLSAPTLMARAGAGEITLTWNVVARADSYELIVWDWALDNWKSIGGVLTGTNYVYRELIAGTTYHFHIRALGAGGAGSAWSALVSAAAYAPGAVTSTPTASATATVSATPTASPTVATTERGALVALYEATDGDNWKYNNNWLTDKPIDLWYGVKTDSRGNVTSLQLDANQLKGDIPELSALNNLTFLDLSFNQLTGPIPDLNPFSNLIYLNLEYNQLTGLIPELDALYFLEEIFLGDNQLTGPIPDLGALANLILLDLENNQMTGGIPDLGNLNKVYWLVLARNKLSGTIPDLSALSSVELLALSENQLTGQIPNLSALSNLRSLSLRRNMLTGSIPDLSALRELYALSLDQNQLAGSIPDLSEVTNLEVLSLSDNELSGSIPDLSNLIYLEWLYLNNNALSGEIPDMSRLSGMYKLNLSSNQLTGPVIDLGLFADLNELNLADNAFVGPVPDLSSLIELEDVDLRGNRFCLPAGVSLTHPRSEVATHLNSLNLHTCSSAELGLLLGVPENLNAALAGGRVTLTWDEVANAANYELRAWDSFNFTWDSIGGILTDRTYTHPVLTDGRNYYFQVRAKSSSGIRSTWSDQLYVAVVPTQFPPPPLSLGFDMSYQKYMEVGGVHVVGPSEVPDGKMIQAREIISAMLSNRSDLLEAMADYDTRIYIQEGPFFIPGAAGIAYKASNGQAALVPIVDENCVTFIHEFTHLIHFTIEEMADGEEFDERLDGLYQAALTAGLWPDMLATADVGHYWTETVRYWLWERMPYSLTSIAATVADYDPEVAELIEEVFGEATLPAYCMP